MTRPIANPQQNPSKIAPFAPINQLTNDRLLPNHHAHSRDDPSRWSSSQLSELRPRGYAHKDNDSSVSEHTHHEEIGTVRRRATSFSTVSDKQSVTGAGKRGELRIVIDRSEDRPKSADEKTPNTALGVHMPHYRLGSPRFNKEGSAALHSSVYTRASMSDNFRNSTWLGSMADPSAHLSSAYGRESFSRYRPSFAVSMFSGTAAIDLSRASPAPRNSMVYELKGPVEPSIYERLVSDMDGEAVVRYIPGTKDISAATPARIVAQISSESFMDYELVSDFFLTFRCYLSPSHLLALLLARLEWAINRPQEDGRIIRIRTFAALRHWILNYFIEDFVMNDDLRIHFCESINKLYQDVKSRENGGMSDLKILLDLKRCWNGKCSVYWTASDYSRAYNGPDCPIVPGNTHIEYPSADTAPRQEVSPVGMFSPEETSFRENIPVHTQHDRNDSAATAQSIPLSTTSEQSLMALSCSLPPKSPRRFSFSHTKSKGPRPVQLSLKKTTSPHDPPPSSPMISRHPFHGHSHKRSASFSDSVRNDRAPMVSLEVGSTGTAPKEILDPVSFIRGALYPPAESYMTMMAPESPPLAPPSMNSNPDRRSTPEGGSKIGSSNSGMRTIIGSIKRALHTRNGGQSVSARMTNASEGTPLSSRGKTSAMPNNISLGSEYYRERKLAAAPRRPARLDVLCEEALKQYRLAMDANETQKDDQPPLDATRTQNMPQESCPDLGESTILLEPRSDGSKLKSGITSGSGSIVIVDDTGFELPSMSGAVQEQPDPSTTDQETRPSAPSQIESNADSIVEGEFLLPIFYNDRNSSATPEDSPIRRPSVMSSKRRSYTEHHTPPTKRTSLSLRLRKYASFQSGISKHRQSIGRDADDSIGSSGCLRESTDRPFGPSLRRRPGGNLRQMQFVDDVDQNLSRESFMSTHSYGNSLAETTTTTTDEAKSRPPTALVPPNPHYSLIRGKSNRNIRRSFEAAIARFADIPDDSDGGVESTLLKLEGKWSPPATNEEHAVSSTVKNGDPSANTDSRNRGNSLAKDKLGNDILLQRRQTDKSAYSTFRGRLAPPRHYSDSVAESEESYNSIPLLERGLTDESMKRPPTAKTTESNAQDNPLIPMSSRDTSDFASSHPSIQIIQKTDSLRQIPRGSTNPESTHLNTGQDTPRRLSALSSEISVDMIDSCEAIEGRVSADTLSLPTSTLNIPPHPLAHPPSPPMTIQHPGSFGSCTSPMNKILFQDQPLTPDTSPRRREEDTPIQIRRHMPQFSGDVLSDSEKNQSPPNPLSADPGHVPFVLACESQVLAQQLTLVEMAALSEVDWRDLVDMRWSSGSPCILNWVQFLASEERKGIDLVVGRFNLMVKWVVSEIVLTIDIHERAQTIVKYIHTAAHARRICNYATMLQIAIALSSSDCCRLQKTWQLIPQEDKRLFKDMECLVQPVRNFHDLRVEMETANLQEGCIPFIGKLGV